MPNKPIKRMRMSLSVGGAPPSSQVTINEPPTSCNENSSGWDSFCYEVLIEEAANPAGTSVVVKAEPASPEPHVSGDESDDSFVSVRPVKRRSVRATVANSDEEDVKPSQVVICDYGRSTGSESGHHISGPGEEFIRLEAPVDGWNVGSLGCSARIVQDEYKIVLHDLGCLMLVDDSFVARVKIMDLAQLSRNRSFRQAKTVLLRQLSIVQVLLDNVTDERNRCRAELMKLIQQIPDRTATSRACAADAVQIIGIIQKCTELNFIKLCQLIRKNPIISDELRNQADKLLQIELATEKRNSLFQNDKFLDNPQGLNFALKLFCEVVVENHAKSLLDTTSKYVHDQLAGVPHWTLFRINASDVKVFHDLDQVLNKEIFQKPLDDLAKRWSSYVKSLKPHDTIASSAVNPIYFSLCRSLEELIVEIAGKTDHNPEELLLSDHSGWHAMKTAIKWKKETSLTKCIQREYCFIMRLLKHFDPASGNAKTFGYLARRLLGGKDAESALDSFWRPLRRFARGTQQNPLGIPDEFYVWYCMLDDVLHHVLPEKDDGLDIFEQILKNFIQLLRKATFEQIDMIRVITHSVGRFIVQTAPFVKSAQLGEDKEILQCQLDVINRTMLGSESTKYFRDLIDVFSGYWKNRCGVIENIPLKNGLQEMEQIKKSLLAIVIAALRKSVGAEHVIDLFRSLNDFIVDLDDISFDWLIKTIPEGPMKAAVALNLIKPVDNKWSGTDNETHTVVEPKKFQQLFTVLLEGTSCPKHYVLDVVIKLLECIRSQLDRTSWANGKSLSNSDQILSTSVLISSIRSSLIYLREQAEYVSFEVFLEERIKPFCNVVENSASLNDFIKRAGLIKESFSYIRKQNEMSIAEALRMYGMLNDDECYNAERLRQAYQQYSDHFEKYMKEPVPQDSNDEDLDDDKAYVIACMLKESAQTVLFKEWTDEFKLTELPRILAGVAAIWSITVSEDMSSSGNYFKPHCIQVLCVLRLLGADNGDKGMSKHLAQVLTGQGKSLVLALIASVLALTGHRIQVACYNNYLVNRDAKDFKNLYRILEVEDLIEYGTFEDMANAVICPVVDGKKMSLRTFVTDLILSGPGNTRPNKPEAQVKENSVLLMDEVDVFFTKDYYGSQYRPCRFLYIPGLEAIQIEIWMKVNTPGNHDVRTVKAHIEELISSQQFDRKAQFDEFLHKSATYKLLVSSNSSYVPQKINNKKLFSDCLTKMISNAINVATNPSNYQDYQLNHEENISRKVDEKFVTSTVSQYYSIFNYFRLKKENFVPFTSNSYNFGYLNIGCGSLSYAMLPKAYPLILGVTGTLTSLNHHEKAAIDRLYSINRSSLMPSFYGCSNLRFDSNQNFTYLTAKPLWMSKIFTKAHTIIAANRAVIIFFYNDTLLEEFRAQYCAQFDRLQTLTENTEEDKHEHLISEAGVPKTVTLATRGMGRGVDYKSSVAVEKNGGVHVLQTFFSLDVKEETQIRGRTARKDNKGSYELIVLKDHLEESKLIGSDEFGGTYGELDAARANIAAKENEDIAKAIESGEQDHNTTLEYLHSFFD